MTSHDSSAHPNLQVSDVGHVRILRIDREAKLGALSTSLVTALAGEFSVLASSTEIRSVILTGTGRGFIAGADIEEYAGATAAEFERYQRFSRATFESLASLPQVTIAAVNGYALGGGFELALCCDFILAAERAKFGLPEVKLGLTPGGGGIDRLVEAAGSRWAKEIIMSGRIVEPAEAFDRGVVSAIVAERDLLDRAVAWATDFAAKAPLAVREVKAMMNVDRDRCAALAERDVAALGRMFDSDDGREGIRAFSEKREADFRGH